MNINQKLIDLEWIPKYYVSQLYNISLLGCEKEDLLQDFRTEAFLAIKKYYRYKYIGDEPEVSLTVFVYKRLGEIYVNIVRRLNSKKNGLYSRFVRIGTEIEIGSYKSNLEYNSEENDSIRIIIDDIDILEKIPLGKNGNRRKSFKLHMEGWSFPEISAILKVKKRTLQGWFREDRKLMSEYFISREKIVIEKLELD